jgi:hypothetical protein
VSFHATLSPVLASSFGVGILVFGCAITGCKNVKTPEPASADSSSNQASTTAGPLRAGEYSYLVAPSGRMFRILKIVPMIDAREPQRSLENRPFVVTAKPANG